MKRFTPLHLLLILALGGIFTIVLKDSDNNPPTTTKHANDRKGAKMTLTESHDMTVPERITPISVASLDPSSPSAVFCHTCRSAHQPGRHLERLNETLRHLTNRDPDQLRHETLPDGSDVVYLGKRFAHVTTAQVEANGEISLHCQTSAAKPAPLAVDKLLSDSPTLSSK